MPTSILPKFSASSAITITLGGLAHNAARQGTIVDNSATRHERVILHCKAKLGTSPTANGYVGVYLIRDDDGGTPIRDDNAGSSDAAITLKNARLIGSLLSGPSPATGDVLSRSFVVDDPGPKWTVAVLNASGVALDATGSNHAITFVGVSPEVQ